MKKIAPRISDQTAAYMTATFENLNAAAEFILEAWPLVQRRTLHGLKGRFEKNEIMLMIDVMNGTYLPPALIGQHLPMNVSDGIALDRLNEKWDIDADALNKKVTGLAPFEACCLELWIQAFWSTPDLDADEYVKPLLANE